MLISEPAPVLWQLGCPYEDWRDGPVVPKSIRLKLASTAKQFAFCPVEGATSWEDDVDALRAKQVDVAPEHGCPIDRAKVVSADFNPRCSENLEIGGKARKSVCQ